MSRWNVLVLTRREAPVWIIYSESTYDAGSKTISSSGIIFCPFRGETSYRTVLNITDENSHSFEMYVVETDGTKFLTMKIVYTRKTKGEKFANAK